MLRALIFDVDGTLADTEEAHREAFNAAFREHSLDWRWSRERYRELLTVTGGKERIAAFIETLEVAAHERSRLMRMIPELHSAKTRLYTSSVHAGAVVLRPGVRRLLQEANAASCQLAIASTTTADNVVALLERNLGPSGSTLFSVVACGDIVAEKKPAPDIYLLALERLKVDASNAIAFEDSAAGLQSASSAGLRTVVTPTFWTAEQNFSAARWLLPSLGEPSAPLAGEPGNQLRLQPWLSYEELAAAMQHAKAPASASGMRSASRSSTIP